MAKYPTGPAGQLAFSKAMKKYGHVPTVEEAWGEYQRLPTNATQTMVEAAPHVLGFVRRIRSDLESIPPDQLGPVEGRWSELMAGKIGTENPQFTHLRTDTELLATLLQRMHTGARGGQQMRQDFKNLINSGKQSPANLRAALERIEDYANEIMVSGQDVGTGGVPAILQPPPETSPDVIPLD